MSRCRDGSEPASYRRLTSGVNYGDWDAEFDVVGRETGCLHHIFNKEEVLAAGCLGQHHVFMFGGSVGTGIPMNLIHLLKPAKYPITDVDAWAGCEGCNVADHWSGAPGYVDVVFDRKGVVLSIKSSITKHVEISESGEPDVDGIDAILSDMKLAPSPGPGGLRVTFFRARYYKAPAAAIKTLFDETTGKLPYDYRIIAYSGVQHWWYNFCDSSTYNCLRTDIKYTGLANILSKFNAELTNMLTSLDSHPKIRKVVVANFMWGEDFNVEMDNVFKAQNTQAQLMDERSNPNIHIGFEDLEYYAKDHPTNLLHTLWMHRLLNIVCDNAGIGDVATLATVHFKGPGCTLKDRESKDTWAQHLYQPCDYERTIEAPPTLAPTPLPTKAGCSASGTGCKQDEDCCTNHCDVATSLCLDFANDFFFPTAAPTIFETSLESTLDVNPSFPVAWTYTESMLSSKSPNSLKQIETKFVRYPETNNLPLIWFHYVLAVVSSLVLAWWYWGTRKPKEREAWVRRVKEKTCFKRGTSDATISQAPHKKASKSTVELSAVASPSAGKRVSSMEVSLPSVGRLSSSTTSPRTSNGKVKKSPRGSSSANHNAPSSLRRHKSVPPGRRKPSRTKSSASLKSLRNSEPEPEHRRQAGLQRTTASMLLTEDSRYKSYKARRTKSAVALRHEGDEGQRQSRSPKKTSVISSGRRSSGHKSKDQTTSARENGMPLTRSTSTKSMTKERSFLQANEPRTIRHELSPLSSRDVERAEVTKSMISNTKEYSMKKTSNHRPSWPKGYKKAPQVHALGFARYVASVHIVAGHLWRKDPKPIEDWYTSDFGFTWVPWFMMLSGYVLTYSRVASSHPKFLEQWYLFLYKRVKSIYPLYLVGLLAAAALTAIRTGESWALGSATETILSLTLTQAWLPSITERVLQAHCWFLSCIVPYWMGHNLLYRRLIVARDRTLWFALLAASVLPTVLLLAVPAGLGMSLEWYKQHMLRPENTALDNIVVVLKFHPVSYAHIYLVGCISAVLHVRRSSSDKRTVAVGGLASNVHRYGACIGYVVLFSVFVLDEWVKWPASGLTCRLGALAPFQALTLVGLSTNSDPLAKLFSSPWLRPLGSLSYPQYVFQFIAFEIWGTYTGLGFWLLLNFLAVVGYLYVQSPLSRYPTKTQHLKKGVAGSLAIIGGVALSYLVRLALTDQQLAGVPAPARVQYTSTALDIRIDVASADLPELAVESVEIGLGIRLPNAITPVGINPVVVWDDDQGEMVVAFRRHHYYQDKTFAPSLQLDGEQLSDVAVEMTMWNSDVVVGKLGTFTPEEILEESRIWAVEDAVLPYMDSAWSTCQSSAFYIPENNTVSLGLRYGREDPRIARTRSGKESKWFITFNSLPMSPLSDSGRANGGDDDHLADFPTCSSAKRMFSNHLDDSFGQVDTATMLRMKNSPSSVTQKNWLSFQTESGEQRFIQSILPFVVLGAPTVGNLEAEEISRTINELLKRTSRKESGIEFHGGANPVAVEAGVLSENSTYVSTFHTLTPDGKYVNYAFTFTKELPHEITMVSKPLPLLMEPIVDDSISERMTFSSGLTYVPAPTNRFVLSYGSSNSVSRMLLLSPQELRALLDSKASTVPTGEIGNVPVDGDCSSEACVAGAVCVKSATGSMCIQSCEDPQFNWDCPFWSSEFRQEAENICQQRCRFD